MQQLKTLDLYHLAWESAAFAADPHPEFEAARARHPWLAKTDAGYVIFELKASRDLLTQDDKLLPAFDEVIDLMGAKGSAWGRFAAEQMIALPDQDHMLLRRAFAAKFTPRYANELRPLMTASIEQLLDAWVPQGDFDFEEFASYYPVSVISQMIGAPLEAIPELRSSLETLGLAFSMDKTRLPALDAAIGHMDAFVEELMAQRRANPHGEGQEDLLDTLIAMVDTGQIPERQLRDMLIFLYVGGYDTSKNVLTYMMYLMTRHLDIYERCASDHDYCRKVVEEALRLYTPSTTFRVTTADIDYRDVRIPKGTTLFFTLNVAGRDPTAHPQADQFDPERAVDPALRHVGFGLGRHMCLGQYLARAQLQEGIHAIAKRIKHPRLAGDPGWRPYPGVWGINGLPLSFEPA